MNAEIDREDETILAVLAALETAEPVAANADEATETLSRLYRELVGLLAYQEPPASLDPGLRRRLMTAVVGDETQEVKPAPVPAPAMAAPPPVPAPVPAAALPAPPPVRSRRLPAVQRSVAPAEAAGKVLATPLVPPSPPARVEPAARPVFWTRGVALAAAALVLVLMGTDIWLATLVIGQRDQVARLSERLRLEQGQRLRRSTEATAAVGELDALKGKLSLMTSREVLVAGLHPMGTPSPLQPDAHGVVFVAADHQHWYVSVAGLAPNRAGHCYQLWFVTPEGPQNAATFNVTTPRPVELSSPQMPSGTREVWVTLEPVAGSSQPTGPAILAASQFQVL